MRLAILIATSPGRRREAARARAAYRRETPGTPTFVLESGRDVGHAWKRALAQLRVEEFDLVHFTVDRNEPHPGWLKAARADGRQLAAPMLWTSDGELLNQVAGDWRRVGGSAYPTMTPEQIERFGVPPFAAGCEAKFVLRADYAFTVWD